MTRVYGLLFEDRRSGILAVQPSAPFFGCQRHEQHFEVIDGEIDINLMPTPGGVFYNVGFKDLGDTRRTDFTLRWRIPNAESVDITPNSKPKEQETQSSSSTIDRVQMRRLTTELADALECVDRLERDLEQAKRREADLASKFEAHKRVVDTALEERDRQISVLSEQTAPQIKTVIKEVPVPPEPLEERIEFLEREVQRLNDINDSYYQSVLELHQLKLERAQSAHLPTYVEEMPGTPQQRLINKLRAK